MIAWLLAPLAFAAATIAISVFLIYKVWFSDSKVELTVEGINSSYVPEMKERNDGVKEMTMHIGEETFPVFVGNNKLSVFVQELKKLNADTLYLGYDENTIQYCAPQLEAELNAQGVKFFSYVMGLTEENKDINTLNDILRSFFEHGGTRKTVVVPVGGGIVANTFGLAAALLFRGIRLVQCPTTLLNAHDAAASSQKQAINHTGYKNVVGCFYKPTFAFVDTSFFSTLGETEIKAGLGELTKNAALFGGRHYDFIKSTVMTKGPLNLTGQDLADATFLGLGAKDMLLTHDPREKTIAIIFEYGHTVGHALELTQGVETSHGEGVTVGMLAASYISTRMGFMTEKEREKHDALVFALQPKVIVPAHDITDEVMDKVRHDNKRGYLPEREGFCPFLLLKEVGVMHSPNKYSLEFVPEDIVREAVVHVVSQIRQGFSKCN